MKPLAKLAAEHGLKVAFVAEVICREDGFYRIATAHSLNGDAACPRCGRSVVAIQLGSLATSEALPWVTRVAGPLTETALRAFDRAEPAPRQLRRLPGPHQYRDPADGTLRSLRPSHYERNSAAIHARRKARREAAREKEAARESRRRQRLAEQEARGIRERRERTERRAQARRSIDELFNSLLSVGT